MREDETRSRDATEGRGLAGERVSFTRRRGEGRIGRSLLMLALLLGCAAAPYTIPFFLERLSYAMARGRLKAEYESASERLAGDPLSSLREAYEAVSQKIAPSVVHINVTRSGSPRLADEMSQLFPRSGSPTPELQGQGSGVIMDPNGFVVTNHHVIEMADEVWVTFSDGGSAPALVVGADPLTDLAVLKVDPPSPLIAAEWGDSDSLKVGAPVWAVGSPFGLQHTVTSGIVSATNRVGKTPYQDFLQTDAAVNPGNSGGPLVDTQGRVVGVNTAIVGENYQGISFAVPSKIAQQVYDKLKGDGEVARGWLGVQMEPVTRELAIHLGLDPVAGGAIVRNVVDIGGTSPARRAGVRIGDVIVSWDGRPVVTPADLSRYVAQSEIGGIVEMVVIRRGEELPLRVHVAKRPASRT